MEVDEREDHDPAIGREESIVKRTSPVREEIREEIPAQASPSPAPQVAPKSPSPPALVQEEAESSQPVNELRQTRSPERIADSRATSMAVADQTQDVAQAAELSRTENTSEDIIMGILRTSSRSEAVLPIARVESQTKYVLAEQPSPAPPPPDFAFDAEMSPVEPAEEQKPTIRPSLTLLKEPTYKTPPLKALPVEYNRKGKVKQSKKRDKDRADGKAQEWQPLGMAKWSAMLRANPVHKKVAKAAKCLNTHDWNASYPASPHLVVSLNLWFQIAFTELRLIRTFERIDVLKEAGRWSFRQPKKQRGVGGLVKSHWDHLLDEMVTRPNLEC